MNTSYPTYYSEDTRSRLLEIHAEHILWNYTNEDITLEDITYYFQSLIEDFEKDL